MFPKCQCFSSQKKRGLSFKSILTSLVLQEWEHSYNVTNVEYTEFEKLGISDECAENSQHSRFPANTNVLYVGLQVRADMFCCMHVRVDAYVCWSKCVLPACTSAWTGIICVDLRMAAFEKCSAHFPFWSFPSMH